MKKYLQFTFLFFLIASSLVAQVNLYDAQQIARQQQLLQKIELRQESREARVRAYIEKTQSSRYLTDGAGREWSLFDVNESGFPIWNISANAEVAGILHTSPLHSFSGYNLLGSNVQLGLWEAGGSWAPRASHEQLVGRISNPQNGIVGAHATWMAGTMIASGNPGSPQAKGMAPEASVLAHSSNDLVSLVEFGLQEGLISNHSYALSSGWSGPGMVLFDSVNLFWPNWIWWGDTSISQQESQRFGQYSSYDSELDQIAEAFPYHLMIKAAGNARGLLPDSGSVYLSWGGSKWDTLNTAIFPREPNGGVDGYDCIPWGSVAKNILLVGGVTKDTINAFLQEMMVSGWGPTDDGRIKPDLVAPGGGVLSTGSSSDNHYSSGSGTSFSTAAVSGSLALVQEMVLRKSGRPLLASTLRAIAIHTATPNSAHPGPNYRTGYGVLNTEAAVGLIDSLDKNIIIERELEQGETFRLRFYNENNAPIKASLCWTDEASNNTADLLNDRTPRLINDLDLRLVYDPDGNSQVHLPWKLDPDNPGNDATRGDNIVDNVEVVLPASFDNGVWEVEISHKGNLSGGGQTFSLILSGVPYEWEANSATDTLWSDAVNWKNSQVPPNNAWVYVPQNTSRLAVLGSQKAGAISIAENAEVVVYEGLEVFADVHNRGGLKIVDGQLKWSGSFWGTLEYIRSGRSEQIYLSSPFANSLANQLGNVSVFPGNVFSWNANDAQWVGVYPNDTLSAAIGYLSFYGLNGVDSLRAFISLHGNPLQKAFFRFGFNYGSSSAQRFTYQSGGGGWNFLGNPFTAPFDFEAWQNSILGIGNSFYIWDSENENHVAYSSAVKGIVDSYIAPLQGFWVQKVSSSPQNSSSLVRMREHSVVRNNVSFYKGNILNTLILVVENSTRKDSAYIVFKENANHAFDSELDAWKLPSGKLDVSTKSDSDYMAINAVEPPLIKSSIEVYVESNELISHTFSLNQQYLFEETAVWVEDRKEQLFVNLREENYIFQMDTNWLNERFFLHFGEVSLAEHHFANLHENSPYRLYFSEGQLFITAEIHINDLPLEIYNSAGQKVWQSSIQNVLPRQPYAISMRHLPPGLYIAVFGKTKCKFVVRY